MADDILRSRLAEAKTHIEALVGELIVYHQGRKVRDCFACDKIAAAKKWLATAKAEG